MVEYQEHRLNETSGEIKEWVDTRLNSFERKLTKDSGRGGTYTSLASRRKGRRRAATHDMQRSKSEEGLNISGSGSTPVTSPNSTPGDRRGSVGKKDKVFLLNKRGLRRNCDGNRGSVERNLGRDSSSLGSSTDSRERSLSAGRLSRKMPLWGAPDGVELDRHHVTNQSSPLGKILEPPLGTSTPTEKLAKMPTLPHTRQSVKSSQKHVATELQKDTDTMDQSTVDAIQDSSYCTATSAETSLNAACQSSIEEPGDIPRQTNDSSGYASSHKIDAAKNSTQALGNASGVKHQADPPTSQAKSQTTYNALSVDKIQRCANNSSSECRTDKNCTNYYSACNVQPTLYTKSGTGETCRIAQKQAPSSGEHLSQIQRTFNYTRMFSSASLDKKNPCPSSILFSSTPSQGTSQISKANTNLTPISNFQHTVYQPNPQSKCQQLDHHDSNFQKSSKGMKLVKDFEPGKFSRATGQKPYGAFMESTSLTKPAVVSSAKSPAIESFSQRPSQRLTNCPRVGIKSQMHEKTNQSKPESSASRQTKEQSLLGKPKTLVTDTTPCLPSKSVFSHVINNKVDLKSASNSESPTKNTWKQAVTTGGHTQTEKRTKAENVESFRDQNGRVPKPEILSTIPEENPKSGYTLSSFPPSSNGGRTVQWSGLIQEGQRVLGSTAQPRNPTMHHSSGLSPGNENKSRIDDWFRTRKSQMEGKFEGGTTFALTKI